MKQLIREMLLQKKEMIDDILNSGYLQSVEEAGRLFVKALKNGGKILLAGNGGSAADAQHFAGEMVGRFMFDRAALPALSLCTDPSVVSCIANDYGYEAVFARQLEGLGKKGDVFVPVSTSGNSQNLIQAVLCDISIIIPSKDTPRIQEFHTFTTHVLCDYLERCMFTNA